MMAYAFTKPGGRRPFAGRPWPEAGTWADHVRASRVEHLPVWLAAELWVVELEGSVHDVGTQLRADRGRLVRRVDPWDGAAALAFAQDCAVRVRELAGRSRPDGALAAYLEDAASFGPSDANVAGWVAARAAAAVDGEDGAARERRRQAGWLAARLGLESPTGGVV
jgi:hypothetical protein